MKREKPSTKLQDVFRTLRRRRPLSELPKSFCAVLKIERPSPTLSSAALVRLNFSKRKNFCFRIYDVTTRSTCSPVGVIILINCILNLMNRVQSEVTNQWLKITFRYRRWVDVRIVERIDNFFPPPPFTIRLQLERRTICFPPSWMTSNIYNSRIDKLLKNVHRNILIR